MATTKKPTKATTEKKVEDKKPVTKSKCGCGCGSKKK